MTNEHDRGPDELESLLAGLPAPAPSPAHQAELRRRVLETFDRSAPTAAVSPWRRAIHTGAVLMRHPASRFALAAAVLVVAAFSLLMPSRTFALTDLIAPIVDAKSARFQMSVKMETQPNAMTGAGYFLAPNRFRQEYPGLTSIADFDRGRMVTLMPGVKQALIVDMKGKRDPDRPAENYFGNLQSTLARYKQGKEGAVRDLGAKQVDGRKLVGFQLSTPGQLTTIWGDAETGRPTRIEAESNGPVKTEVTFSDIQFDVPLDVSLFALEPPADYTRIETEFNVARPGEKDFVAALDRLVRMSDGEFPAGFDPTSLGTAFGKAAAMNLPKDGNLEPFTKKLMADSMEIGRGLAFANQLPRDADAHYAGNKIKRDGPRVAVFWYRPAGSPRYRVVWSDLSATDADAAPTVDGAVSIFPALPKDAGK